MTTFQFNIGDKVQWESQSSASRTTKTGTVYAIVHSGDDPHKLVPNGISASQIKFDSTCNTGEEERYVVAVPRGGRSTKADYYYPRNVHLKPLETSANE